MPPEYGALTVAEQLEDTDSTLSLTRRALELRKTHPGFSGRALEWFGAPDGCLAFRRAGTTLVCALNGSAGPVPLPPGDLLLASGPLTGDQLPPNTAAWLA
jgi:alpha-glucosidase